MSSPPTETTNLKASKQTRRPMENRFTDHNTCHCERESAPAPPPLVSIIINNFNYAKFLDASIQSALGQTHNRTEVIVVDDGSTDNSKEVIDRYKDRVKPILKENGGQGSAFNAGFKASSGDLVLFLDSDDTLCCSAIDEVVRHWRQGMSKLHFPLFAIDENGKRLGTRFPKPALAAGNVLPTLLEEGDYCTPPTSGNVFSRAFLSAVLPMPEEEWRGCSDCYIAQTAPFYGEIGVVAEMLGEYRLHTNSLTSNVKDGQVRLGALHVHLELAQRKQRLLNSFAEMHGLRMRHNAVVETQQIFKFRLISLKLSPSTHPIRNDRLWPTFAKLLALTVRDRKSRMLTKLAYITWATLMACLPPNLGKKLAVPALSTHSKSKIRAAMVN